MKSRLEKLLLQGENYVTQCPEEEFGIKPSVDKWSKKEILGHLVDSGIYNLQRFTEIQYKDKPFLIREYNQDEQVKVNNYQHADTNRILGMWLTINYWIMDLIDLQTEETFLYEILFEDGTTSDLRFLMEDYINHLEHHLNQIMV